MRQNAICLHKQTVSFHQREIGYNSIHIPAALILGFKVTFIYFLTLHCKRHAGILSSHIISNNVALYKHYFHTQQGKGLPIYF